MSNLRSLSAAFAAIALGVAWSSAASASTLSLSISDADASIVTDTSSPFSIGWQQFNPTPGPSPDSLLSNDNSNAPNNSDVQFANLSTDPLDRSRLMFSAPSTISLPEIVLGMVRPSTPLVTKGDALKIFTPASTLALIAISGPSGFSSNLSEVGSGMVGNGMVASIVNQSPKPTRTTAASDATKNRSKRSGTEASFTYVHPAPEPPAIMLAGLGVVGAAVADRTRRLRRARATNSDEGSPVVGSEQA